MRGVRGGLKDQVKAFREFLRRRKKKRRLEENKLKFKKKKDLEEKKKREVLIPNTEFILNNIEEKIINEEKIDLHKASIELNDFKMQSNNYNILDRIEEVKEKVEVEIIFSEIIDNTLKQNVKRDKVEKLITVSSNIINKTDNIKEINHYFGMVNNLYNKHSKENNNNVSEYVALEEQVLRCAVNKKNKIISNKVNNDLDKFEENSKFEEEIILIEPIKSNQVLESSDNIIDMDDSKTVIVSNDDVFDKIEINNQDEIIFDEEFIKPNIKKEESKNNDLKMINDYVNSDSKFKTEEFDIINNNIQKQIIYNENEINRLKKNIKNINNIFKEKSGFDMFMEFTFNVFNLGRGLIGKHVFGNHLVRRLNSDILINNSIKGIHRLFTDEKQEVPYIVFKSFEKDINDKKDCALKINDICEDSLAEIRNLKSEFMHKYGSDESVLNFLKKMDKIELDLIKRQEDAKKIEKQAIEQYNKNYQKVKIKK